MPYHLYARKPVKFKAARFDGTHDNALAIAGWVKSYGDAHCEVIEENNGSWRLLLNQMQYVIESDWVLQDEHGQFDTMSDDHFDERYTQVHAL